MNEAWSIGVFFRMFSNAKTVLGEVTVAAKEANASINGHTSAMNSANASAKSASGTFRNVAQSITQSGNAASRAQLAYKALGSTLKTIAEYGSYAALGTAVVGVRGASNLQDAMLQMGVATGLPMQDVEKYHTSALKISQVTAQSVTDSMGIIRDLVSQGTPLSSLTDPYLKSIAQYADMNYVATGAKHLDFDSSVTMAGALARELGVKADDMPKFADELYRTGYQTSHGPSAMLTQIRQYAARAQSAGMSPQEALNIYAELDRHGLGMGRGGTGINMLLKNLQDPRGKTKIKALEEIGVYNKDGTSKYIDKATGNVDFIGFLTGISDYRDRMHLNKDGALSDRLISRGFDTNAANVLEQLATKGALKDLTQSIPGMESKMPSLQAAQAMIMSSLNNQLKILNTNFQSFSTEVMKPLLHNLTVPVTALAEAFGKLSLFMNSHQKIAGIAGTAIGLGALYGGYKIGGRLAGGVFGVTEHGPWGRVFGLHGASSAAHAPGVVDRAVGSLAKGLWDTFSLRGTRGIFGDLARGLSGSTNFMGLTPEFKAGFMRDMGLGLKGLPGVSNVGSVFTAIGEALGRLTRFAGLARVPLAFLGDGILKFGLKAIPVIGEISMLIDVLKFLGNHASDIGKILADVTHWIIRDGAPMLFHAFIDMVKTIAFAVKDTFMGIFSGFKGGMWDSFRTGLDAFKKEWAAQDKNDHASSRPNTNPTGHGPHIVVHKVELHTNSHNPKEHAAAFIDHLIQLSPQAMKTIGGGGTPHMARPVFSA